MYKGSNATEVLGIVGIAGGSCAGKGYLCHHLHAQFTPSKCSVLPMDCYYKDLFHLPLEERHASNFDHPDALDYELFQEHLKILISGGTVSMPVYDFRTHTRSISNEKEIHARGKVLLVDGIFALYRSEISQLYDVKVFVDLDPEICLKRRIERDVQERGRTREILPGLLRDSAAFGEHGAWMNVETAARFHIPWPDRRYGDHLWLANPGVLVFPDFFHRIAPYKGRHGYDPSLSESQGVCVHWGAGVSSEKILTITAWQSGMAENT